MPNFNKGAFGQTLRVTFNFDVSAGTAYKMELEPQFRCEQEGFEVVPVLGTVDVTVDDEKLIANEYVEYVILKDDLRDIGRWRVKAFATLPSETVVTNFKFFQVLE